MTATNRSYPRLSAYADEAGMSTARGEAGLLLGEIDLLRRSVVAQIAREARLVGVYLAGGHTLPQQSISWPLVAARISYPLTASFAATSGGNIPRRLDAADALDELDSLRNRLVNLLGDSAQLLAGLVGAGLTREALQANNAERSV